MDIADHVRELGSAAGFDLVRFASAEVIIEARAAALRAREQGQLDGLGWMTQEWLERATDPGRFMDGARSVILLGLACHHPDPQLPVRGPARGRVARYARGRDYHRVFESRLRRLARVLRDELRASARPTVDYGPLLERPLAAISGMGWLGKSTMLLAPGSGPWVLLGAIATSLDIPPDPPLSKSCGSCRRCIAACPTGALTGDGRVLDAPLCISYQTIENRGPIPRDLRPLLGDWVFGCDLCLDSCPVGANNWSGYEEFASVHVDQAFPPLADLIALDEESFVARFQGRAIMRAKRDGLARNACVALGNVGGPDDVGTLLGALGDGSALVRGHAAWALGRLRERGVIGAMTARARVALERALAIEQDGWAREEVALALVSLPNPPVEETS